MMIIDPQLKGEFGRRDFPHDLDAIVLSALINFFNILFAFAPREVSRFATWLEKHRNK